MEKLWRVLEGTPEEFQEKLMRNSWKNSGGLLRRILEDFSEEIQGNYRSNSRRIPNGTPEDFQRITKGTLKISWKKSDKIFGENMAEIPIPLELESILQRKFEGIPGGTSKKFLEQQ